jgi:hypothetical protein
MRPTRQHGLTVSCPRQGRLPQFRERFLSKTVRLLCESAKIERRARRRGSDVLEQRLMLGRIAVSLTLVAAILFVEGSVSSTCGLLSAANQKACASPCCGTKPCCAKSEKRDTDSVPPFTTSTSSQQNFVASTPAVVDVQVTPPPAIDRSHFPAADVQWHSPETLALLCIRLI